MDFREEEQDCIWSAGGDVLPGFSTSEKITLSLAIAVLIGGITAALIILEVWPLYVAFFITITLLISSTVFYRNRIKEE